MAGILGLISTANAEQWNGKIIRTQDMQEVTQEQMISDLATAENIVMGEKHYTAPVQQTEGMIIAEVVKLLDRQTSFTTAWEFLNWTDKTRTERLFSSFVNGEITAIEFLKQALGGSNGDDYTPVLEATKTAEGQFIGINISRQDKAPVVQGGIQSADPKLIPPGFDFGSPEYHDRFVKFMSGGHAPPDKIENYYAAQCLTDDTMAYQLLEQSSNNLRFIVAGSFHTDFFDGFVARLKIRAPGDIIRTVRIIDASDYTEAELLNIAIDEQYGKLADFVYFVNEPGTVRSNRLDAFKFEFEL